MADPGAEYVDRKLYNLEKRIAREYRKAEKDVQRKLNNYLMKFAEQEKVMRARLEAGEISQKDYNDFMFRKTMMGKRWQAMRDSLAADYHNANMIAKSIYEGYLPGAYAINHDYATYEVEHDGHFDTNYTLYDRHAAEKLLRDEYKLIPDPKPGTEAYRRSQSKDLRWNMQKVQSAVLQGILQGSRLSEIAANLERVTDMNHSAAVRNARSMMTAAQNAGRQDGYERAQKMSIKLEKVWMATLDNRTRHSHRWVHGERRPINATFSNGCRFPGDPEADPSEYYNCRCTMGAAVEGLDLPIVKYSPKMGDLTFEEWREEKMPKKEKAAAADAQANTGERVKYDSRADYTVHLEGYPDAVNKGITYAAEEVARRGSSSGHEHLCLVNLKTGRIEHREESDNYKDVGDERFRNFIKDHPNERFAFVHNHNTDGQLSEQDMVTVITIPQTPIMVAMRNDGVSYAVEREGDAKKIEAPDSKYERELEYLNVGLRNGTITMNERTLKREVRKVELLARDYTKGIIERDGRYKR